MTIRYINGDLLQAPEPIIVQGVNARGVMGAGVALAIRKKWPEVYDQYRYEYDNTGLHLGDVIWSNVDGKLIANAITQQNFGNDGKQYCDYVAIENALKNIKHKMDETNYHEVAMPKIGSGFGGGDWAVIEAIVSRILHDKQVTIYYL